MIDSSGIYLFEDRIFFCDGQTMPGHSSRPMRYQITFILSGDLNIEIGSKIYEDSELLYPCETLDLEAIQRLYPEYLV